MAKQRATGTGRSGKSMYSVRNSKQSNPVRLAGSAPAVRGSRANGRGSTGAAPLTSSSSIQDTAGRAGRNAVGKVVRGGNGKTTSLT